MIRVNIPLAQFYNLCLESAQQEGYSIVLCLIAREADSPEIYNDLVRQWSSFHDVTGDNVLFLFAGDTPNKRLGGEIPSSEAICFSSNLMTMSNPKGIWLSKSLSDVGEIAPYLSEQNKLTLEHTLQISDLRKSLKLSESDIPCLHITYLRTKHTQFISLSQCSELTIFRLYHYVKQLIEVWEPIFNEISRVKEQIADIKREFRSEKTISKWEQKFLKRRSHIQPWAKTNSSIDQMVSLASKPLLSIQDEYDYYTIMNNYRKHHTMEWDQIGSSLQSLIDLHYNAQCNKRYAESIEKLELRLDKIVYPYLENVLNQPDAIIKRKSSRETNNIQLSSETIAQAILFLSKKISEDGPKMIKILFLAANPVDTTRLRLDEEIRAIDQSLRQTEFRERFDIKQHWAVRVSDLQGYLLRHQPHIVHFSGHGSNLSEIILEDDFGNSHSVSTRSLSQLFSVLKDNIQCVVLNACYSEQQADAIAQHINCVIGMSKAIGDTAAIKFATAFYQALGYGRDVKTAFDLGCLQIDLENLGEQDTPKLLAFKENAKEITFVQ